jgi:phosphoglycolate phosphatase-like HAD superfamily hydrolase
MGKKLLKEYYKSIIFDFDGVILDSNDIKKNAIKAAVKGILNEETTAEFVDYFTSLNGVPREVKILKYISKKDYVEVLTRYQKTLNEKLSSAKLIPGIRGFLVNISVKKRKIIVLSGGAELEVRNLITLNGLGKYFQEIYGGPKNKQENLSMIDLEHPVMYFGDSEVDYNIANKNNFDFVFVYGASSLHDWKIKTASWNIVCVIKNFEDKELLW